MYPLGLAFLQFSSKLIKTFLVKADIKCHFLKLLPDLSQKKKIQKDLNSNNFWQHTSSYTLNLKNTVVVVDRGTLSHISNMNFQFWAVFSLGQSGLQRKKIHNINCHNLRPVFYVFSGKKVILSFIKEYPSIRTKKLHWYEAIKRPIGL